MDNGIRGRRLQVTLAVTGAIAFILQGYDQALMDGLLTLPAFVAQFPSINATTPELADRNSTLQGTAVALYEVGAALGALSCFYIGDRYGRKRTTLGAAVVVLIGVILQSTTYSVAQLIVARIWTGLGVGAFTATIPTWVGESVSAHDRGSFVMLEGSTCIFGVAFVSWLEFGFYFVGDNPVSWRFPIALQALFAIAVLSLVPFLAESPRWLVSKDRLAEAAQVLARLEDKQADSDDITHQIAVLSAAVRLDSGEKHTKNPFARTPVRHLNRTLLAIGVNVFSQICGINIVTFYSNTIFEGVLGFSGVDSRVITACLQVWQFIGATSAVFFIERFGRRGLLLFAAAGMTIAHSGLAGLQSHVGDNHVAAGCSLIFYFVAMAAFPIGFFLVPFMYASEIAPLPVRARVTALSTATNWILNFVIAEVTPKAFNGISWRYYLVYVCTNVVAFICIYLFAPETKGRSLEDIDAIFLESSNAFQPVKVARLLPAGVAEELALPEKTGTKVDHVEEVA